MEDLQQDRRLYLWVDRSSIAMLQSCIEGEDGLARVRTERNEEERALILLMVPASREQELLDHLRHLRDDAGLEWEFVDSAPQSSV